LSSSRVGDPGDLARPSPCRCRGYHGIGIRYTVTDTSIAHSLILDSQVGTFARLAKAEILRSSEIACWMYSGERQVIALRKAYLDAVLRQDVGFFDTDARTGDIVFGVSTDTLLVQDAIGEKVGNFLHYIATFLAGLVVGFISAWRLALLSVALIPPIAFAGGLYAYTLTGLTSRSRESYANAGVVAEQVILTLVMCSVA
jgi:ABC-type multidrug transport system fused ATPase/permease subunit